MNRDTGFDYRYNFSSITDTPGKGQLNMTDYGTGAYHSLYHAVADSQLIKDTAAQNVPEKLIDLIDIANAVYVADRLTKRHHNKTTTILIELPLRSDELREDAAFHQQLRDLLYWFTEDLWTFRFSSVVSSNRLIEITQKLPWEEPDHTRRVALWSGGLDALAGLYDQLVQEPIVHYTLFGTGANTMMLGKQKSLFALITRLFPQRLKLIRVPLLLHRSAVRPIASSRARGFVFLLLGAVCALLERQERLYVHENGIGALNLPFRDCEVGLDHSRSVHPLSLDKMSTFLSSILDRPFVFENPFLFHTKAEVCTRLLQEEPGLVPATMSCDSWHRRKIMQCGYCSSCLLRRLAIVASGNIDATPYQITAALPERKRRTEDRAELVAMLAQVEILRAILSKQDPWQALSKQYPVLEEVVQTQLQRGQNSRDTIQHQLLHLYKEYVQEWMCAGDALKMGLLL